jgi:hypothetical protein
VHWRIRALPSPADDEEDAVANHTPVAVYIDAGAKRTLDCAREVGSAMQCARQDVVDMLRRTGLPELAEETLRVLPDPVDLDFAAKVLQSYGVTRDELIDRMGGSP